MRTINHCPIRNCASDCRAPSSVHSAPTPSSRITAYPIQSCFEDRPRMNQDLQQLQPYPFEKLRALVADITPNPALSPISLSIGEPKHASPAFVLDAMAAHLGKAAIYPSTAGLPALRQGIADWLSQRFQLPTGMLDTDRNVLPVTGTREALFSFTQAVVQRDPQGLVVSPNPFYQIYEGAALLAGVQPHYLACDASNGFIPDFDKVPADIWRRCQLLFICSPG